jgi:hypothetical protein
MIKYIFEFGETKTLDFEVDEHSDTSIEHDDDEFPDWLLLERSQCERCPLPIGSRKACPAALSIRPVVEALEPRISYEKVEMTVERDEITLNASISIQQAARSLIGLVLPLSACPVMMKLRPMARLHLPLGKRNQTAFRFLGMYLIAQYIKKREGHEPDWTLQGLLELIDDIHMVNLKLTERIRTFTKRDATVNALVVLDFFANNIEWSIDDSLEELRPLFATLLSDG